MHGCIVINAITIEYESNSTTCRYYESERTIYYSIIRQSSKVTAIYAHAMIFKFILLYSNTNFENHVGNIWCRYYNLDLIGFNSHADKCLYFLLQNEYESMINSCTFPVKEPNSSSCTDHNLCKDNRNDY